jgi:hypothetical protein
MSDEAATTAVLPAAAPTKEKRWGARSIVSLILFIIAALLAGVAMVGHWGHRTVIDSERYIATVGPLINQPEVQQALGESVTNAVVAKLDTQNSIAGLLTNLFPNLPATSALAAPLATGINGLVGDLVTKFIASPQFATVWIQLNTVAQKGMVAVLEGGDSGPVQIQGDNVVLDTSIALTAIQQKLVDSGIAVAGKITIPQSDRQVVLFNSPALGQIRFVYALTAPILQWLPLVIAVMFALSIALARRRARTVVATGIVLVVWGVILWIGTGVGQAAFTNQLSGTPWAVASSAFWDTLLAYLIEGIQGITLLGVVLIVAGWFGGRTELATKARGHVVKGLTEIGARTGLDGAGSWVASNAMWLRWVVYGLATAALLFSGVMSMSTVFWVTALAAGLVTAIQVLVGAASAPAETGTNSIAPSEPLANA